MNRTKPPSTTCAVPARTQRPPYTHPLATFPTVHRADRTFTLSLVRGRRDRSWAWGFTVTVLAPWVRFNGAFASLYRRTANHALASGAAPAAAAAHTDTQATRRSVGHGFIPRRMSAADCAADRECEGCCCPPGSWPALLTDYMPRGKMETFEGSKFYVVGDLMATRTIIAVPDVFGGCPPRTRGPKGKHTVR